MQATISLRAPAIGAAPGLAVDFVGSVAALAKVERDDAEALRAVERLVRFVLEHAYRDGVAGDLAVEAHLFDGGIRFHVDEDEIVCYSDEAKALKAFVFEDKERVAA